MTEPATSPAPEGGARLQVAQARPSDMGCGTARLGPRTLRQLGAHVGAAIEIVGKRTTAAIALELPPEDRGLEIVRLDGFLRANAGVGIGDTVTVRTATVSGAKRVHLAPTQGGRRASESADGLRRALLGRPVVAGDLITTSIQCTPPGGESAESPVVVERRRFGLAELRLQVVATTPSGVVRIAEGTEIRLITPSTDSGPRDATTYDDLGGLDDAVRQVREMIELPLKHPELFRRLGIDPPKGVLLYGPPGTGKTLLARAVATEADARFIYLGGPEIITEYQGQSEERLREIFQHASEQSPAIIFLDEIDAIAPKRESTRGETERRVVAQLLTLMDGLEPRRNVIVMGATNLVDAIDEALRRPGRFDREIAVGVPDREGRREILAIHARGMPLAADVDIDRVARTTHGFVGADLAALAREAAIDALRRILPRVATETGDVPPEVLAALDVTAADFESAQKRVHPSAMRELLVEVPDVGWDDVGGLEETKRALREGIELPLKHPEAFDVLGIRPACGFLLFGPPGTGKTRLARAVAGAAEANFIAARASELLSKWHGESERQVARLFARARQVAPAVIFLDEIDSLAPARGSALGEPAVADRIVNTLLAEMDGLQELRGVVVIGATNRPAMLDPALLRPGRFDELVYVPVPDRDARLHILGIHSAKMPLAPDVRLEELADRTRGYTGADLEGLVRRAGLHAFRLQAAAGGGPVIAVPGSCFELALAESRASVTPDMEREYEALLEELKREAPRGRRIGFSPAADPPRG